MGWNRCTYVHIGTGREILFQFDCFDVRQIVISFIIFMGGRVGGQERE